jgi:hypothetical protein
MKNKLKSIIRGSKTAAASQAKTKPSPAFVEMARLGKSITVLTGRPYRVALRRIGVLYKQELAKLRPGGTVTCVCIKSDDSEWARVEFEREEFLRIVRAASKLGITLQQLFDNAIRNSIELLEHRRAA